LKNEELVVDLLELGEVLEEQELEEVDELV